MKSTELHTESDKEPTEPVTESNVDPTMSGMNVGPIEPNTESDK